MTDFRIPRGYERNVAPYQEICEGVRPTDTAAPREAYTGLAHVRVDEMHHDFIVIDAGTIVGRVSYTGAPAGLRNKMIPAVLPTSTGVAEADVSLFINGSADANNAIGIPSNVSGAVNNIGFVRPLGVCTQATFSFHTNSQFSNYDRNVNVPIVTDYVIMIPATNAEEHAIRDGEMVGLGSGTNHGIGWTTELRAGRYAAYNSDWAFASERIVGRCLKKIHLGTSASAAGTLLKNDLTAVTVTTEAAAEFQGLNRVQTVPGLNLSGSGTKGLPARVLDASLDDGSYAADGSKSYWALVLLIRL